MSAPAPAKAQSTPAPSQGVEATKPAATKQAGLDIQKASYGVAGNFSEVTQQVKDLVRDGNLSFTVSPQAFAIMDPAPGVKKTLQVKAAMNGGTPTLFMKDDGEVFSLSAPPIKKDDSPTVMGTAGMAFYGIVATIICLVMYFGTSFFASNIVGLPWTWSMLLSLIVLGSFISISFADMRIGAVGLVLTGGLGIFCLFSATLILYMIQDQLEKNGSSFKLINPFPWVKSEA